MMEASSDDEILLVHAIGAGNDELAPSRSKGRPADGDEDGGAASGLTILTWNVWFGSLATKQRFQAIVEDVIARDPDVACFQEVTAGFTRALRMGGIEQVYAVSPNRIDRYGCLTLVKHGLAPSFSEVRLPTQMGRSLVVATLNSTVAIGDVVVGNVHLESLDNEPTRRLQLRACREVLESHASAVLCGDFNFDSSKTWGDWRRGAKPRACEDLENHVLEVELPGWLDTWPTLMGVEDPGYTFDGATNPACVRDRQEQMRYDRVMVKHCGVLAPSSICMIGTDPVSPSMAETLPRCDKQALGPGLLQMLKPSDHYGLLARLRPTGN